MRSTKKFTQADAKVHEYAAGFLQEYVGIEDHGPKCTSSVLLSVLFFAAASTTSISDACKRLRRAPSDQGARDALEATLPEVAELEARFNLAFSAQVHKSLQKHPQSIAIDLVQRPYYGKVSPNDRAVRRGKANSGTTRFHTYATAYLMTCGRRTRWSARAELRKCGSAWPATLRESARASEQTDPGVCLLGLSPLVAALGSRDVPQALRHRNGASDR